MNNSIQQLDLTSFLNQTSVQFGNYTHACGAHDFVYRDYGQTLNSGRYEYLEQYSTLPLGSANRYQVVFIEEYAYVMYEVCEKIKLWVCYTETEFRGRGFMSKIFEFLKTNIRDKEIIVHTHNPSLIRIAKQNNIKLFQG